ncbi:uncharacterized protein LOC112558890 [Pomacea canaliculata]|uniref:uncharacterized protein LOC112558890 n=1 Tax=Pomacea canaliculata TaxID=400727 RepID=UPI000D73191E|nr:uncharacterized protein LOC112558890 [Pomacea canaliculata]
MVFYRQGLGERINVCLFLLALADLVKCRHPASRVCRGPIINIRGLYLFIDIGFSSAEYVSQLLSAVIACERCFCVVSPLHAKRLLKTSTMTAIVVVCSVVLMAGMFVIIPSKHFVDFIYDPSTNITKAFLMVTKFYLDNKKIVDIFDIFIYSTILPIFSLLVQEVNSTSLYFTLNIALWHFVFLSRCVRSSVHFCVYYIMGSKFREYVHSLCLREKVKQ